jgi:hypothetical protein
MPDMKALLILPSYFRAEERPNHASTSGSQRTARREALERTLIAWRALFGPSREIDIGRRDIVTAAGQAAIDIVFLVNEDRHLLDDALLGRYGARRHAVATENPRYLPFGAHVLIKRHVRDYDWFVYSEDDLLPHDPDIFRKQMLFQQRFGVGRLLQPNRYEINPGNRAVKTYVDGPLRTDLVRRLWSYVAEGHPSLLLQTDLGEIKFERARNPHAGFFMLSQAQAQRWVAQSHFMDLDCSFVSPLESAGSLSLLKTFSLYKAARPSMSFLEIEHQDRKFSRMSLPERLEDGY